MNNKNLNDITERIACFLCEEKTNEASCDFGFNIFETAGIVEKEVYMGNVLAELINPKGAHGQKFLYLDLFFKHVLTDNRQTERSVVHTEHLTGSKRWIDIVIEDGQRLIPIEVKINAGDQENQCADYVKDTKSPVYYLTIDGRMPSDYSTGSLTSDEIRTMIKPISWQKSVIDWLSACIEASDEEHTIALMNLRQFLSAVKKFCLLGTMDKYRKKLDSNRHDKIAETLWKIVQQRNLNWKRLEYGVNTEDKGINYFIGNSENEFFRVLCEGGATKVGKIFGLNASVGNADNWVFIGPEYEKKRKEKYSRDWWICEETIVTRNKAHLLFDEDCLRYYVNKIIESYERMS